MARHEQTIAILKTGEVAWLLGTHNNTVRRWADRGIIRSYRINHRGDRRFKREDVARLLDRLGA